MAVENKFLKVLLGKLEAEGEVWLSPAANIGYLTQEVFDLPLIRHQSNIFIKTHLKSVEKSAT